MKAKIISIREDYYLLSIDQDNNSYDITLEKSDVRHLIQTLDNGIWKNVHKNIGKTKLIQYSTSTSGGEMLTIKLDIVNA